MPKFDVAISFLYGDEPLARQLADVLGESLDVFVFSKRQEQLAGTDGLEEFRAVFRHDSRLVVVLYRDRWGQTPWTRVELQAIEERFLAEGPEFLLWVMVDSSSTPPKWLPENRIRLNLADYTTDQLVGAVRFRASTLGAAPRVQDPVEQAQRLERTVAFRRERDRLFQSEEGVAAAGQLAEEFGEHLAPLAKDIQAASPGLAIATGGEWWYHVIASPRASLSMYWFSTTSNSLSDAQLLITEHDGRMKLPNENSLILVEPRTLSEHIFRPDLTEVFGWCWRGPDGKHYSSEELAQWCIRTFFKLVDRQSLSEPRGRKS